MPPPDKSKREDLIANLLVLLDHIPQDKIDNIIEYLTGKGTMSVAELKETTGLSGLQFSAITSFIKEQNFEREYLLLALETALGVRYHVMETTDLCELIWTAPVSFPVPARSTLMVIKDMIASSKENITVVGYRVEEYALPIIEALYDAMDRMVDVTLVLDRAQDQLFLFRKIWNKKYLPPVYTSNIHSDDPMAALHAKLIITDSHNLLITSANLTYHGLVANIEIGVKIRGRTARNAQMLLNSLIRSGDLVKLT